MLLFFLLSCSPLFVANKEFPHEDNVALTSCKGKTTVDDEGNLENPAEEEDDNFEEALADEWW